MNGSNGREFRQAGREFCLSGSGQPVDRDQGCAGLTDLLGDLGDRLPPQIVRIASIGLGLLPILDSTGHGR